MVIQHKVPCKIFVGCVTECVPLLNLLYECCALLGVVAQILKLAKRSDVFASVST